MLQRASRHLLIEGDPQKNSGISGRGIGIPRRAFPHRVRHCVGKVVWQHGSSFTIPNVDLKRPVYYTALPNSLPPRELLQSNSCPGACSLFRIIANRDPPDLQSFSVSRLPPDRSEEHTSELQSPCNL